MVYILFQLFILVFTGECLHYNCSISVFTSECLHYNCSMSVSTSVCLHYNCSISVFTSVCLHYNCSISVFSIVSFPISVYLLFVSFFIPSFLFLFHKSFIFIHSYFIQIFCFCSTFYLFIENPVLLTCLNW